VDDVLYAEHALLERDHWWFLGRRAIVAAVLERHLPAQAARTILDAGCGTGGMLPLLARFGTVRGLEPAAVAVAHCHEAFPDFVVDQGEVPDAVPADGAFDVVTAFDVIEHIADDLGAARALRAATRPGGTVVVTVPALAWLWSEHDDLNGHHRRYDRAGLAGVLERAGLEVRHLSSFNTALLPIVAAARLAQRVRPRPVTPSSDFTMPGPLANRVLTSVLSAERRWVAGRGLPIGVSLVAVARRPT
jgi:2-polyprenyl-3-methyl-5-hydroxy-6-metoxy-1,4-benzoquinol methylase